MLQPEGFLNLLKPPGITSHDAVAKVRRILGTRSVGHAGTLDPAASGVLPMAVGKATRLLEYVVGTSKAYIGEATFGWQTDTLDQEGRIDLEMPASFSLAELTQAMVRLTGSQLQSPPAFSAIKYQGKPLHEYARQGEFISLPGREIVIDQFRLLSFSPGTHPRALFRVDCSKGTYIRVLVKDLATALQTVATLTFLLRVGVGGFFIQDTVSLEELEEAKATGCLSDYLQPMDSAVRHLPAVELSLSEAERFVTGRDVVNSVDTEELAGVYHQGRLLGIALRKEQRLLPHKVLVSREELAR